MAVYLTEMKHVDQRICRFFGNGKCFSGKNCRFSHDLKHLKKNNVWLCLKYINSGYCYRGKDCPWEHIEWTKGLQALPRICPRYLEEIDQSKFSSCRNGTCNYLHFTSNEFRDYIKDQVIPARFDFKGGAPSKSLVVYSSDEETHEGGRDDDGNGNKSGDSYSRSRSRDGSQSRDRERTRERSRDLERSGVRERSRDEEWSRDRERSKDRERSRHNDRGQHGGRSSPKKDRSRTPVRSSHRGMPSTLLVTKKKYHGNAMVRLRCELDDMWKENRELQQELDDHKSFHTTDQELISDMLHTRDKLEEDVDRLKMEKEQLIKQVNDLFSDNKAVVEENQRLRGLLQEVQSLQEAQSRLVSAPSFNQTVIGTDQYQSGLRPNLALPYQQLNWN